MRLLLIGLLVGGCAEQVEHVEVEDAAPFWGPSGIYEEELQCRDLLGGAPDSLTDRTGGDPYLSFPLRTTGGQTVTITNGTLAAQGGILFKELLGTKGVTVRIEAVGTDAFGTTYTLKYRTSTDPTMRDYCAPGEVASALWGEWNNTAFRTPTNRITFACGDAAVKKCYGFGYVPDNVSTSWNWRAHQACTRMARADICGDGTPGTRKLTPIVIRDYLSGFNPPPTPATGTGIPPIRHATTFPAPPDQHFYESAWSWRENVGAVCMERDRWASVGPLSCPNLVNPHLDATGKFCGELADDAILNLDGILVNASKTQDMFIHLWRNPITNDTVSTVRGFWRGDHGDPIPFADYTEYLGEDGILLRNPPYSLTRADVAPAYSIKVTADDRALLTSSNPLLTPSHPSFEGYLLLPRDGVISFGRYTRTKPDGTTDTVTSIGLPAAEWTFGSTLENVLTAPSQEIEPLP